LAADGVLVAATDALLLAASGAAAGSGIGGELVAPVLVDTVSVSGAPLDADEPLGVPLLSPSCGASAADWLDVPRTEPERRVLSSSPVTHTGVPSDFWAHNSLPVMVLEADTVPK
jgi:hypothetical protein